MHSWRKGISWVLKETLVGASIDLIDFRPARLVQYRAETRTRVRFLARIAPARDRPLPPARATFSTQSRFYQSARYCTVNAMVDAGSQFLHQWRHKLLGHLIQLVSEYGKSEKGSEAEKNDLFGKRLAEIRCLHPHCIDSSSGLAIYYL